MGKAEAVPAFGWPTWMHHAHREQHSHVVEIINPGNAAASPADIGHLYPGDMDRYADRLDTAADRAGKTKSDQMGRIKVSTVGGQACDLGT